VRHDADMAPEGASVGGGMRGAGYYDSHSEAQQRVLDAGAGVIRAAIQAIDLDGIDTFVVADYGCGTGATSVHAVGTAIDAVRTRDPDLAVAAVHNDVPTNDFTGLFTVAAGPDGYLKPTGNAFALAAAGSFFDQVVPSGTVHLGMSSNASHWFRTQPAVGASDGMYTADVSPPVRAELAALAAEDWLAFLSARAAELAPGGRMVVQGIAEDGENVSAAPLLAVMWQVAAAMAEDGLLDAERLQHYVFPVYCRSVAEVAAPTCEGGELATALAPPETTIEPLANPYWEQFERDADAAAYAATYTAFVRAFAESTLTEFLFSPAGTGGDPGPLCDEFFARFEAATAADPAASRYDAWILRAVFAKR
jgi:hypothetical protein